MVFHDVAHHQDAPLLSSNCSNLHTILVVQRQGLLAEHVLTRLERLTGKLGVGFRRRGDDHTCNAVVFEDRCQFVEHTRAWGDLTSDLLPRRCWLDDRCQGAQFREIADEVTPPISTSKYRHLFHARDDTVRRAD